MIKNSDKDYKLLIEKLQSLQEIEAGESLKTKLLSLSKSAPGQSFNFSFFLTKISFVVLVLVFLGSGIVVVESQKSQSLGILTPVKNFIGNIRSSLKNDALKNTATEAEISSPTLTPIPSENSEHKEPENTIPVATKIPTPTTTLSKTEDPIKKVIEEGLPIKADQVLNDVLGTTNPPQNNPGIQNPDNDKDSETNVVPQPIEEIIEDIPVNLNLKISL